MSDMHPPRRRTFPLVFLALIAFACGVLADRAGWLPGGNAPAGLQPTFKQAWDYVKRDYVDPKSADDRRMTRGAIVGMLASLGDVGHTTYLTPEDVKHMQDTLSGKLEGIGATITMRKHQPTIMWTLPNSPARKAGLKPGDVIEEVDHQSVAALSLQQLVNKVRGPAGTDVELRLHRAGQSQPLDVTITRGKVDVPDVTWGMLPGAPVAHVALREFGSNADEELRKALKESRDKGARALIIDVRGNPGGLKDQAVAVTSEFLNNDQVVFIQEDAHGRQRQILAKDGGQVGDLPVVVLIDGGTASSAEIFAGALKDHGKARLVGTTTFGTGTVLKEYPLRDGSALLLAVYKWLTPDGHEIWHKGIAPDVEVQLPEGANILLPESEEGLTEAAFRKGEDKQLQKAFELIKGQLGKQEKKAG